MLTVVRRFSLLAIAVIAATCAIVFAPVVTAQTPDAFEQNERLGRGVNILGYDRIWRDRSEGRFQEKHFRLIKEGGFQSVRINLHPFRHMKAEDGYRLPDDWLAVLDWALEKALEQDLMVILDLHEFNAMADDPVARKPMFLAFWQQIAPRFKEAPDNVLFEILNEPNRTVTPEMWNAYLREALDVIRETNPHRTVVIGPAHWNGIRALEELDLPEDERNVIVTVHYYSPMEFTHQGAAWSSYRDTSGVEWTGTDEEIESIVNDFKVAQQWADVHELPIYLGEFGAYEKADMDSRARYTAAVARVAEGLGWSWSYWQFDSDFILYDIDADEWVEPIHQALVPAATTRTSPCKSCQ